ncbi:DUF7344 domain-containing protein [Natrialbaceae archaeon A-gly3]
MDESDWKTLLTSLTDESRCQLLISLIEQEPSGTSVTVPDDIDREMDEVPVELTHIHLPQLEDAGYITWDRESGEVVKGPEFDEVRPLLEVLRDNRDAFPESWPL